MAIHTKSLKVFKCFPVDALLNLSNICNIRITEIDHFISPKLFWCPITFTSKLMAVASSREDFNDMVDR